MPILYVTGCPCCSRVKIRVANDSEYGPWVTLASLSNFPNARIIREGNLACGACIMTSKGPVIEATIPAEQR